jgi:hypothetical protein
MDMINAPKREHIEARKEYFALKRTAATKLFFNATATFSALHQAVFTTGQAIPSYRHS